MMTRADEIKRTKVLQEIKQNAWLIDNWDILDNPDWVKWYISALRHDYLESEEYEWATEILVAIVYLETKFPQFKLKGYSIDSPNLTAKEMQVATEASKIY